MNATLLQAAIHVPTTIGYQAAKITTMGAAKKIVDVIGEHVQVNKIIIITALALSCLATMASIVYSSMLSLSLSAAFLAASCLCYSINNELTEKQKECKSLQGYIVNEDRVKQEHLQEHNRMSSAISRLELLNRQSEAINRDLQSRLARALELVEFCDKAVSQAAEFSLRAEALHGTQKQQVEAVRALGVEQRASVEEVKAIGAELQSYKQVLTVWLADIKRMVSADTIVEQSADKIIRILEEFSRGQHVELARMLVQLKETQEQISSSSSVIKEQQETLKIISKDISKRTAELHEIHLKLASLHLELVRKGGADIAPLIVLDPQEVL